MTKYSRHSSGVLGVCLLITICLYACDHTDNSDSSVNPSNTQQVWFQEVAVASGIDFVHKRNLQINYWLPEIMSGGAAWIDYDKDGYMDLYLVQGGDLSGERNGEYGNVLLHNQGDGTFADVTAMAGVGDQSYGMGSTVGDYDGDGWADLYVTNVGPNILYRNKGDGTFRDVTEIAHVGDASWSTSAAFLDYDRDGDLDLFVANYVNWAGEREIECFGAGNERDYCHPRHYNAPAPDTLYLNDGNGAFTDASVSSGIRQAFGHGLGVVHGDFNANGWLDIYVANDGTPNQLWINQGDGQFLDQALISGVALNMSGKAEAGMGVGVVDLENDGDLDLFVTHLRDETNTFYLNNTGTFRDITATAGFAAPSIPYTGFGVGFADFDHDTKMDAYIANGRVGRSLAPLAVGKPFAEPNQLFRGLEDGHFDEIPLTNDAIGNSRAASFADYDNDGDVDVLVINNGDRARLFKNLVGDRGNWIQFQVLDPNGQAAIGSLLRIDVAGSIQRRQTQRAYSYCTSNDPRVHFGLGSASEVSTVAVVWPDLAVEEFGPFPVGQIHVLKQNTGRSRPTQ